MCVQGCWGQVAGCCMSVLASCCKRHPPKPTSQKPKWQEAKHSAAAAACGAELETQLQQVQAAT